MTLLLVLAAWFLAGVLATLVMGPRLRRAAELAGAALEPEPVFAADRSPLRWRVGTLGVVGLLAGSTGMAAAGALPGSAQTIAHHVLGTVGVHVPEAPPATEVASTPTGTPWGDVGTGAPPPSTSVTPGPTPGPAPAPAGDVATGPPGTVASGGDDVPPGPSARADEGGGTTEAPPEATVPEPSDVATEPVVPGEEPSDVPPDEAPPTTTTPPPGEETPPTTEAPPEEPPLESGGSTTTTTTVPADPGPPPAPPAG